MANPTSYDPVFTVVPSIGITTLAAATTPITSRLNITGTTGLTQLCPVSTAGKRIDVITIRGLAVTAAGIVFIWLNDGTTSRVIDEFPITVVAASNTVEGFSLAHTYTTLILPATYSLYCSLTVANDLSIRADGADFT